MRSAIFSLSAVSLALLLGGCCSNPKKENQFDTVPLDQAVNMVNQAIVSIKKNEKDNGIFMSEAHVRLSLVAEKDEHGSSTIAVILPIDEPTGGSAKSQATSDQLDLTFQSFLGLPTNSVAGAQFLSGEQSNVSTTQTDVTNPDTKSVVKTTGQETTHSGMELSDLWNKIVNSSK